VSGDFDDTRPRWPERDFDRDRDFERQPPEEPPPPPPPEPTYEPPDEPPYQPAYVRPPEPPYRSPYQPEYEAPPEPEPEPERPEPEPDPSPETEATETTTTLGDSMSEPEAGAEGDPGDWDPGRDGDRRRPTTAEQAVPWLIGMLLALAGIVVVLMALIFIGPEGVAGLPSGSPSPSISAAPSVSPTPIGSPTPIPTAAPTVTPPPTFGALEMTYLGRAKAATPIRLLRHDFATTTAAAVLAEDPAGVRAYAWAPDGRDGVAIIAGRAVAVVAGKPLRTLTDPVDAVVFADDSTALYGLRITRDGTNDRAEVLSIEFGTGATQIISTITYPHPAIFADPALKEAQFADNGGIVRLWMSTDGDLVAWILGAPSTYRIDPAAHTFTTVARAPVLWSPDQRLRVDVAEKSGSTTLSLFDSDDTAHGSVKITGLVSHVRWAGSNNEIAFTLGRLVGGGVRQDLYVWDLQSGKAPSALTSNGASFGAEWLGVLQSWVP
jgi:hypothetical protein